MSQFDQDCITYTQEGRILQLEYAAKAVESAEYSNSYAGLSLVSSARTESFLELKSKSFPNCLLITLIAVSTMWIAPSEWCSQARSLMADT